MQYITPVVVTSFPCFNKVTVLEWSIFIRPYKRDLLYRPFALVLSIPGEKVRRREGERRR